MLVCGEFGLVGIRENRSLLKLSEMSSCFLTEVNRSTDTLSQPTLRRYNCPEYRVQNFQCIKALFSFVIPLTIYKLV